MTKDREYKCPNCGEEIMITGEDYYLDSESATFVYTCDKCNARWKEYYALTYSSYEHNGKIYDDRGFCIWEGYET